MRRYFARSGDPRPVPLAAILRRSGGAASMDPDELRRLQTCKVGGRVRLDQVTYLRVPAPRSCGGSCACRKGKPKASKGPCTCGTKRR